MNSDRIRLPLTIRTLLPALDPKWLDLKPLRIGHDLVHPDTQKFGHVLFCAWPSRHAKGLHPLLEFQRKQAQDHDVVMDGRDIGTVVLPQAGVKVFLTAAPEARARRRTLELQQRGQAADFDEILREIAARDEQDRNRPVAPLRQAEDAVLLDTTDLDLKGSLEALLTLVRGRLKL